MSKSRDIYFCLGFYEFLGSQENHRIITGKSIDIYLSRIFRVNDPQHPESCVNL